MDDAANGRSQDDVGDREPCATSLDDILAFAGSLVAKGWRARALTECASVSLPSLWSEVASLLNVSVDGAAALVENQCFEQGILCDELPIYVRDRSRLCNVVSPEDGNALQISRLARTYASLHEWDTGECESLSFLRLSTADARDAMNRAREALGPSADASTRSNQPSPGGSNDVELDALREQVASLRGQLASRAKDANDPVHPRAESTYLNIIGALIELVRSPRPGRDSDAAVIRELIENFGHLPGVAKSTLEGKIAAAKREMAKTLAP